MEDRVQLCGRFVVRIDGQRLDAALPGRKGRLLFAYLVLHRSRHVSREQLLIAGWGDDAPADAGPALSVTLSKLRAVLGPGRLEGRSEITLELPPEILVDVEAAIDGLHRAESHIAAGEWADAWGPAACAVHVAERPLLSGCEAPWIEDWRRRLDDVRLRGLEAFTASALGLGGPALPVAETAARKVVVLAPFRENAHRLLIETLIARGNAAEALRSYDDLRVLLRDELGVAPTADLQDLHRRLVAG